MRYEPKGRTTLRVADLFCGAGGATTGVHRAAQSLGVSLDTLAVNHWPVAVETHAANYPDAKHLCMSVESVDPRQVVPSGHLHLLIAGVECTHHSNARGGRPMNDQSRASAWNVLRWCELLRVDSVLVENVPEFLTWGPLTAQMRPVSSRKGETFRAWVAALESLGYRVEWRTLNAADYGDATTRKRLFVQAHRTGPVAWPEPTHARRAGQGLLRHTQPWRAAREVIDWSLPSASIFGRSKPLSPNTLRRIDAGLRRFGGARSIDEPLATVSAAGTHHGLIEPFTMPYCSNGGRLARPVSHPVGTITTRDRFALVIPEGMDVRFRMLQPHELAAAMGFPSGYHFAGTKRDIVRQIGNAWACNTAAALCRVMLGRHVARKEGAA